MIDYLRDPAEITRRSFEIVRKEAPLGSLPMPLQVLATRLVHACGMPDLIDGLVFEGNPHKTGYAALAKHAQILVDATMVSAGIIRSRLPCENQVLCTLDQVDAADAQSAGNTRSAVAVDYWRDTLAGSVVAIGNAPTALFRLLELLEAGAPRPAVILAFPVGFVGAAESKDALINAALGVPFVTVRGRRGGSAMAAAAVNALAVKPETSP